MGTKVLCGPNLSHCCSSDERLPVNLCKFTEYCQKLMLMISVDMAFLWPVVQEGRSSGNGCRLWERILWMSAHHDHNGRLSEHWWPQSDKEAHTLKHGQALWRGIVVASFTSLWACIHNQKKNTEPSMSILTLTILSDQKTIDEGRNYKHVNKSMWRWKLSGNKLASGQPISLLLYPITHMFK